MSRKSTATKSTAAAFISKRLYELRSRKTQADIAAAAGFVSANMISMIASGRAKLPIERAVELAKALECEPAFLVRLALEQSLTQPLIDQIFNNRSGAKKNAEGEVDDANTYRAPSTAEGVTSAAGVDQRVGAMELPGTSLVRAYIVWGALLGIEVRAAKRELESLHQFIASADVRANRIGDRLEIIGRELVELVDASQRAEADRKQ